jgi:hypothetical protein
VKCDHTEREGQSERRKVEKENVRGIDQQGQTITADEKFSEMLNN